MAKEVKINEHDKEKEWKNLTLSNNFIFQKFMLDPENCKKVLSEILGVEVVKVEYPEYEKVIDIRYDAKSIRLDVYVKGDDTIYNIEMQTSNDENIPKRGRYYQDLIDLDLLEKGADYSELNKSFVIFICTFDFYGFDRYKYTFSNKCDEVEGLEYGDETTKIIINTKGSVGDVSEDFIKFVKAVNGEFDTTEYSAKIKSELEKIKSNDKWRREYMTLNLFERDAIRKGRAEGVQETIIELYKEGLITKEVAIKKLGVDSKKFDEYLDK